MISLIDSYGAPDPEQTPLLALICGLILAISGLYLVATGGIAIP